MPNYRMWILISIAAAALFLALVTSLRPSLQAGAQTASTDTPTASPSASATVIASADMTSTPASSPLATPMQAAGLTATAPLATPTSTSGPAATASPVATGTPSTALSAEEQPGSIFAEELPGGGGHNTVNAVNRVDNRLLVRGRVELDHIPGPTAAPVNEADAFGSCTGCQTLSVGLQVALISKDASSITPQNFASAINYQCTNCVTVARALQYVVQVDDPTQTPDDVQSLVRQMQDELQSLSQDRSVTQAAQAEAVINNVIAQFSELTQNLSDQRQEQTQPDTAGGG
jgi:putative peptide zinc metalloprotease protein